MHPRCSRVPSISTSTFGEFRLRVAVVVPVGSAGTCRIGAASCDSQRRPRTRHHARWSFPSRRLLYSTGPPSWTSDLMGSGRRSHVPIARYPRRAHGLRHSLRGRGLVARPHSPISVSVSPSRAHYKDRYPQGRNRSEHCGGSDRTAPGAERLHTGPTGPPTDSRTAAASKVQC